MMNSSPYFRLSMNSIHRLSHAILLLVAMVVPSIDLRAQEEIGSDNDVPEIYRHIEEGNREHKIERDRWIEGLHRTEPGINWRVVDRETREAKLALRAEREAKSRWSSLLSDSTGRSDTIGGLLSGRWSERGSADLAGRIVCADIDVERGLIYAASGGGNIWRGTLGGGGWRSLNDGVRFGGVVMVQALPRTDGVRLVVASNGPASIQYSDDEGLTWQQSSGLERIKSWGSFRRVITLDDTAHTIYALGNEWDNESWRSVVVLYRSTDGGQSFTNVFRTDARADRFDVWAPLYGQPVVFLLNGDTLMRVDADDSLRPVGMIPVMGDVERLKGVYLAGTMAGGIPHLYAFMLNDTASECYATTDGGATWGYRGSTVRPFSANSIAVSTYNPNQVFLGGVECFRSSNGGLDWTKQSNWWDYYGDPANRLHADIFGIQPFRDGSGREDYLISSDGGIYISHDVLTTVENLSLSGLGVGQYYGTYTARDSTGIIFAGSQDQGFQRSKIDSGGMLGFSQLISGDYGHLGSTDGGKSIWCNYPGFSLYYPGDGRPLQSWSFKGRGHLWLPPVVVDPVAATGAYFAGGGIDSGAHLWHLNSGEGDSIVGEMLPFDFANGDPERKIAAFAISPLDSRHWYVLTKDGIFFYSSDGGENWNETAEFAGPGGHYFYGASIIPSPTTAGHVYIGGSGYSAPGVFRTTDHGKSFDSINVGLPRTLVYDMAIDSQERYLFAATEVGPYLYSIETNQWYDMSGATAPDQTYWSVEYIDETRTARFGTYGRGIWDFTIDLVSGVGDRDVPPSPSVRLVAGPNPATSRTTVSFDLPDAGKGTLRIYDITGRVVAELFAGEFRKGANRFEWDGLSSGGYELPAGSYLCVLNVLGGAHYVKIELVR